MTCHQAWPRSSVLPGPLGCTRCSSSHRARACRGSDSPGRLTLGGTARSVAELTLASRTTCALPASPRMPDRAARNLGTAVPGGRDAGRESVWDVLDEPV